MEALPCRFAFQVLHSTLETISMRFLLNLLVAALISIDCLATELGVDSTFFTIDGTRTFLLGISYYGALGASEATIASDLDDIQRDGFNWIRVWATWAAFGNNISAVENDGRPREPYLTRLEALVKECDRRGMIVDVTLSRQNGTTGGPRLQKLEEHERAVRVLIERLHPYRNWYLDLGNERNIQDKRFVPFGDLQKLRALARELDPKRLVTASHSSDDKSFLEDFEKYLSEVKVDFLVNHRPRSKASAESNRSATESCLQRAKELGVVVPVHFQEPFRRGYTKGWEPTADDFLRDLRGAIEGGAAGWCFHNGAQVGPEDGQPRRSFDLREKPLYEQLDAAEREVARNIKRISQAAVRRLDVETRDRELIVRAQDEVGHQVELAHYIMEPGSRPYLHPVRDPSGRVILTEDRPADHLWQHGIFTGFHRVNGFNYWKEDEGKQRFVRLLNLKPEPDKISWTALVELVAPNGSVVLEEEDHITIHAPESPDAYLIDFDFLLRAKDQNVTFGKFFVGGLSVRMPWDKENPRQTHLNSNGLRGRACEQRRASWCNVERPFGNETFGIAILDHPKNPTYPSGWRADEQGLINPNISALGDWSIPAGQERFFRHQMIVYRGSATPEKLASRFESFASNRGH
jgi:hypothetical protein